MASVSKYIRLLHSSEAVAELQAYFGLEKIEDSSARPEDQQQKDSTTEKFNGHVQDTTYRRKRDGSPTAEEEDTKSDNLDSVIIKNKFWYYLFCFGSELGNKNFYLVFYSFFTWNFSPWLLRRAIYVWVVTMYIGQAAKELIKIPRPASPPAIKMERQYEREYGMPSTHAMVGVLMPFTLLLSSIGRFEYPFAVGLVVAIFWTSIVVLSRMYLGMHSLLDVIAGITAATILMSLMLPFLDMIDSWVLHSPVSPFVIVMLILISTLIFPRSKKWRETHADTLNITSIAGGIALGSWVNTYRGLLVPYTGSLPYVLSLPSLTTVGIMLLRMLVGIPLLILLDEILTFIIRNTMAKMLGVPLNTTTKRLALIELPHRFGAYFTMTVVCVTITPLTYQYLGLDPTGPYVDL